MIKYILMSFGLFIFQGLKAQKVESKAWIDSLTNQFYQYNVPYPQKAVENNIQGVILITFDIDSTCSFINRSQNILLGYGCDEITWQTLNKFEKDMKKLNKNKCEARKDLTFPIKFELD